MSAVVPVPLRQQLACAERELRHRQRLYPRWVEQGRMGRREAADEIAAMQAIIATLRGLPGSFAQEPLF